MDAHDAARRWAETWEAGWRTHDVAAIVALYAEDCAYRSHPFRPVHQGRAGAVDYITRAFSTEQDPDPHFAVVAVAGDRAAVLSDLEAQFRMAAHAGEAPFLFNDSLRFSITGSAFRTIGELLAGGPALFADHDLADLAHRLAALNGGGPFTINTDGDVAAFRDAVQRLFTDDGRGDGRLAPAGQEQLHGNDHWQPQELE